jgi:homogentisate 1,2-dioxygenase
MANPRDFKTPVAAFEDREVPSTVTVKWCGQFHETKIGHSPLDVVAWHGNYAPLKYDLRTYCPVGAIGAQVVFQRRIVEIRPAHLLPGRRGAV